jgi:hypothetical protein
MEPEARKPARSVRLSLVGWGKGEGEEAGAILRVFWPWGFFVCTLDEFGRHGCDSLLLVLRSRSA